MALGKFLKLESTIAGQTRSLGKSDQGALRNQFPLSPIHSGELADDIISGDDPDHGFLSLVLNNQAVDSSYFSIKPSMNYVDNAERNATELIADPTADKSIAVPPYHANTNSPGNPTTAGTRPGRVTGPPNFDLSNQPPPLPGPEYTPEHAAINTTTAQSASKLEDLQLGISSAVS